MIEVFKTNVSEPSEAKTLVTLLLRHFPGSRINFDLHDRDKILRIEGTSFEPENVMLVITKKGYECVVLE